jgi:hypothetical protein
MSLDLVKGLAKARLDLVYRDSLKTGRLDLALEAVKAMCRLFNIRIDGPARPGTTTTMSTEEWQKLLFDAKKRRDS